MEGEYYLISNAAELLWFAEQVNSGLTDINAQLTQDIDLSENDEPTEWMPIGQELSYKGIFDGCGYSVGGYVIKNSEAESSPRLGFFKNVGSEGTVKNLTVNGNITITATPTRDFSIYAGGISATLDGGTISNCSNGGDIVAEITNLRQNYDISINLGGITGFTSTSACVIETCTNSGSVTSTSDGELGFSFSTNKQTYVGGIIGHSSLGTITGCANNGSVTAGGTIDNYVGGISGYHKNAVIANCVNEAVVSAVTNNKGIMGVVLSAGGIVGGEDEAGVQTDTKISSCVNNGSVEVSGVAQNMYAGGIGGMLKNTPVSNSINNGDVSFTSALDGNTSDSYIGGIAGFSSNANSTYQAKLTNCVNTGSVTIGEVGGGELYAGGITGGCSSAISDCVNTGQVTNNGTSDTKASGGIAGASVENDKGNSQASIDNCTWGDTTATEAIGSNTLSCPVTASESKPEETISSQVVATLEFESSELTIKEGATGTMTLKTQPAESANFANHAKITGVTVEPEGIAAATDNGDGTISVTANALGTATVNVTVTLYGMNYETMVVDQTKTTELALTARVNVSDRSSEDMKLSSDSLSLKVGDEATLTASLIPEGTADTITSVTWSSSNEAIATVTGGDDGSCTVKALAEGSATVTAEAVTNDGYTYTATCAVSITTAPAPGPDPGPEPEPAPEPSHGGGGGGCNYGWGALALLALAPLALKRKK